MMTIIDDSHPINPKIHWMASSHGWEEAIDTEMINNTNARWRIIFLQNAKWFSSELFSYDFILFYSSIKGWVIKKREKIANWGGPSNFGSSYNLLIFKCFLFFNIFHILNLAKIANMKENFPFPYNSSPKISTFRGPFLGVVNFPFLF